MPQIVAVIFDLDGTLVNSLEDISSSVNQVLKGLGCRPLSVEEYRPLVGWGLRKLVTSAAERSLTEKEEESAYQAVLNLYREFPVVYSSLYEGIPDMLASLSNGLTLGVLSNKEHLVAQAVVRKLLPTVPFREVWGARPGVPHKPDPTAVQDMIRGWGLRPEQTAFVGDSAVDMQTAVNAGCLPLGVAWGFRPREELESSGASEIFQSPGQLRSWLEENIILKKGEWHDN